MTRASCCLPLAVMITVMACSKSSDVNKKLTIPLGACRPITGNDIRLCYDSLTQDSRCPMDPNIRCVWAGIGVGQFSFYSNNTKHTLTLATYNFGHWRKDTTVAGYTFELLELNPYPTNSASQPAESKSAKVRVKK